MQPPAATTLQLKPQSLGLPTAPPLISHQPIEVPGHKGAAYTVWYRSQGLAVKGFVLAPSLHRGLPGTNQSPFVLYLRGGLSESHKVDRPMLGWLARLAAEGYYVGATQYRGNDGGEGTDSYLRGDVTDALNMYHLMAALQGVDANQGYVIGFSRGGAVAYQLLKQGLPARAACVVGCATDLADAYQSMPHYRPVLEMVLQGSPTTNAARYREISPMAWPEKIQVPLLLLQGEDDTHSPPEQTARLAQKLQAQGTPCKRVLAPNLGHEPEPWQELFWGEVLPWFGKA